MNTPVAMLIFNRPELTERVFAVIARARPPVLLVVADGPRDSMPGEVELCARTRAIAERVDWDCRVLKNYADRNLGCRRRVSSGLDWVFQTVEEAIVLEDDCLPSPSFFPYCEALLDRYRHDQRIMSISGDNFQRGRRRTEYSYYFSKYNHVWGWASWRRAWAHYDVDMATWPEFRAAGGLESLCRDPFERRMWDGIFEACHHARIDTWDYAWLYACWANRGLIALPETNLVTNIGFGPDATHTKSSSPLSELPSAELREIRHPPIVVRNEAADAHTFDHVLGGAKMRSLRMRLRGRLGKLARMMSAIVRPDRPGDRALRSAATITALESRNAP